MIFFVSLSVFLFLVLGWVIWMGRRNLTVDDVFPPAEDEDDWSDLEHDQDEVEDN